MALRSGQRLRLSLSHSWHEGQIWPNNLPRSLFPYVCTGKIAQEVCTLVLSSLPVFPHAFSLSQKDSPLDMTFWKSWETKEWVKPKLELDLPPNSMIERSYSFIHSMGIEAHP